MPARAWLRADVDPSTEPLDLTLLGGRENDVPDRSFGKSRFFHQSWYVNAFFCSPDEIQHFICGSDGLCFFGDRFLLGGRFLPCFRLGLDLLLSIRIHLFPAATR